MKRRLLPALLVICLMLALGSVTALADGSAADTRWYSDDESSFVLYDAADLLGFKELVNGGNDFSGKTVYLGGDIVISDIEWEPIGVTVWEDNKGEDRPFRGVFDGRNHTISGLTMTSAAGKPYYNSMDTGDYYAYGFFGGIDGATVMNVDFEGVNINQPGGDDTTATQNNAVGAVVGAALGSSTIENVSVSGSVTGYSRTAGVVGYIGGSKASEDGNKDNKADSLFENYTASMGDVRVSNCVNNADIKSMRTASSHGTAAGICATVNQKAATSGSVTFTGNRNTGAVDGYLAAGICASTFSNNATGCSMAVTFTDNSNSGVITANGVGETNGSAPKASGIAIINDGSGSNEGTATTYTLAGNRNSGTVTANADSGYNQPTGSDKANRGRSMAAGILVNGASDGRHTAALSDNVNSGDITGGDMAAGIITEAKSGTTVQGARNSGDVTIGDIDKNNSEASGYYVGGIAAYAVNGAELKGSLVNTGAVTLPSVTGDSDPDRYCAGGIVGMLGNEYNGEEAASVLNGASCVSSGNVYGSGTPYVGRVVGQLRTGEVSGVSGEDAIGAVHMVGGKSHSVTLKNVNIGELDVEALHTQNFTYTLDLSDSTIGTIYVDGKTHTGVTLEISGGTVGTVDISGVTSNKTGDTPTGPAHVRFAATNGAKVGTVDAMFAADADVSRLYVATQAWNRGDEGGVTVSGNAGSVGQVRTTVDVTVGFVHNHQKSDDGSKTLSDYRVFTNAAAAIGSIATTTAEVTTAETDDLVPKDAPSGTSYAKPGSNPPASAAYYLAASLDETAKNILNGESGAPAGFTGVELTESKEVESLTIAEGKTLIIPEDVTLTAATVTNNGTIHNYGTISDTVSGSGTVINYYHVTLVDGSDITKCIHPDNEPFTLPEPSRGGYDFGGWRDEAGKLHAAGETVTISDDTTFTAEWSYGSIPDTYDIELVVSDGGEAKTSLGNASAGTTIIVTATPDAGYELDYITVDGERISGNSFTMPDHDVTVRVYFTDGTAGFADVSRGDWFYDYVQYVVSNGLMEGTSATTFEPNANMSRAMVWAILARIDGETVTGTNWVETARAWAMAEGVSDGENANGNVTREQLATMLWRFAGEPAATGSLSAFTDAASVSDWAVDGMTWAVANGIVTGMTDTTIVPQGTATRAQAAAMLMRFVEL